MDIQNIRKHQYWLVIMVTAFAALTLAWEHFNGGVLSHHLLHNPSYPSISNYWSMLILPSLAWFTAHTVIKRIKLQHHEGMNAKGTIPTHTKMGFVIMFCVTALQSIAWVAGQQDLTMYIAVGILVAGLFVPIYRAECILAHVLASSVVFGAVIPLIGIVVLALISALSNLCIKPLIINMLIRTRVLKVSE
ncbi:hypothetical protein [Pseudoalteromonas sp. T1lg23B]|uniref:hypothetical protein n=1 Tax=Pseudoalteromonas sp. T1lg23B TaxID=2077097 RepID=UPI000CF6DCD5|nr:hypothetical protein [Pseudoalteromonas sp. T1lg23B]